MDACSKKVVLLYLIPLWSRGGQEEVPPSDGPAVVNHLSALPIGHRYLSFPSTKLN